MAKARYLRSPGGTDKTPVQFAAVAAVEHDDIVVTGNSVVVASNNAAIGELVTADGEGIYQMPKTSATVITAGEAVDWDADVSEISTGITPASGDVQNCGYAVESAGNGATVAKVRLLAGNGTYTT